VRGRQRSGRMCRSPAESSRAGARRSMRRGPAMPARGRASSAAARRARPSGASTVWVLRGRRRAAPAAMAASAPAFRPPANWRFSSRRRSRTPGRPWWEAPRRARSGSREALSTTITSSAGRSWARTDATQRSVVAPPSQVTTTAAVRTAGLLAAGGPRRGRGGRTHAETLGEDSGEVRRLALGGEAREQVRPRAAPEALREAGIVEQAPDRLGERRRIGRRAGEAVLAGTEHLAQRGPVARDQRAARGGRLPDLVRDHHGRLPARPEHAEHERRGGQLGRPARERHLVAPGDARTGAPGERLGARPLRAVAEQPDFGPGAEPPRGQGRRLDAVERQVPAV